MLKENLSEQLCLWILLKVIFRRIAIGAAVVSILQFTFFYRSECNRLLLSCLARAFFRHSILRSPCSPCAHLKASITNMHGIPQSDHHAAAHRFRLNRAHASLVAIVRRAPPDGQALGLILAVRAALVQDVRMPAR